MTRHITPVLAGFLLVFATMTAVVRIGAASADPAPAPVIAHPAVAHPVIATLVVAHAPAPIEGTPVVALAVASAAAPTSSPAFVTADQLHDPAVQPAEAWDDAKAARKLGWPVALLAALIMLARGIGTAGRNVPWLAWLNKGRAAVIVAGVGTAATAAFNAIGLGGSWFAVVMAAATAFFALISPTSGPAPAPSSTAATSAAAQVSLLAILVLALGAGALLPACTAEQRTELGAALWQCTAPQRAEAVATVTPAVVSVIKAAGSDDGKLIDLSTVRSAINKANLLSEAGILLACATASAFAILEASSAASSAAMVAGRPGLDPATVAHAWAQLDAEQFGGARFSVTGGKVM